MLIQIVFFLLEAGVTLLGGACLVRAMMRAWGVSFVQPVGQLVLALTNPVVRPLQRVLPVQGRWDVAALVAAWGLKLLQYALLMALLGRMQWALLPVLALLGLLKLAVSVTTAVVLVAALLSWTQTRSPVRDFLERLSTPLLAPLRRVLPLVGGFDLSPLLALVGLQVLAMVLGGVQAHLLGSPSVLGLW